MKSAARRTPRLSPALQALAAGLVVTLALPAPAAAQTPEEMMKKLADMGIDFMGITVDIPDRQNLGVRGSIVYAWDERPTPDDKTAKEHLMTLEHLQYAGIPALPGKEIDFQAGMAGSSRYRMGGTITNIDIRGAVRYELRMNIDWQLYDTRSSSVVWEGSSSALARGAVLGDRGEQKNVLLDATLSALEKVLDKEVKKAI